MRAFLLGAGAVALALASPGLAKPGGGHGGGGGGGGPPGGHGGGGGNHGGGNHGGGGGGPGGGKHGGDGGEYRGGGKHGGGGGQEYRGGFQHQFRQQAQRQRGPERRQAKAEHRQAGGDHGKAEQRQARAEQRQFRQEARTQRFDQRGRGNGGERFVQQDVRVRDDYPVRNDYPVRYAGDDRRYSYDGCPPGLAAKGNGCLPPGQAKKLVGQRAPQVLLTSLLPAAYRSWYPDTSDYYYRTEDNYIYRIDRRSDDVLGYAPLFAYGPDYVPDYYYAGEPYPLDYVSYYNVPTQYQRYYQDEGDWLYRYGDGGIYRVNESNGLVDSVVQLLAGDLAMGQPLPPGYDVYNVPYQYRDRYYDTADNWYRYNDGYIYGVDPKTQLITAVIQALV